MPKSVEKRRHCEVDWEHAIIFRNPQKPRCREGVAEDCCVLSIHLAVPSCFNSFWHGVIPTSSFLMIFTLVFLSNVYIGIGNDTVGKQRRSYTQPLYSYNSFVRSAAVHLPAQPASHALSTNILYLGMCIRMGACRK